MVIECTRLNIFSAVRMAYRCLWHYKIQHVMIALTAILPFCLGGFFGLFDPVLSVTPMTEEMPEGFNLSFALLVMATFIWAVPMLILWHRLYLLGPEHLIRRKIWPLLIRSLKVISHSLIFFGMVLMTAVAVTGAIVYLRILSGSEEITGTITELSQRENLLFILGITIVICFLLVISLRISMAFSALAIGKPLSFTTSWRMTRMNTFRMLIATMIGLLPILMIDAVLLWGAKNYFQIDLWAGTAPKPYMIYVFVLLFAPILTSPLALLCSLTSSFYSHCRVAEFKGPKS